MCSWTQEMRPSTQVSYKALIRHNSVINPMNMIRNCCPVLFAGCITETQPLRLPTQEFVKKKTVMYVQHFSKFQQDLRKRIKGSFHSFMLNYLEPLAKVTEQYSRLQHYRWKAHRPMMQKCATQTNEFSSTIQSKQIDGAVWLIMLHPPHLNGTNVWIKLD